MALDPVPWFVGGGAEHSPEIARLLAYVASGGATGVINPTDLKVQPTASASSSVRVAPGAGVMLNNYSGGAAQSYVGRNASETTVTIPATTSAGSRVDFVIMSVSDPQYAGAIPASVANGPYTVIERVTSLPMRPHVLLARIDIPVSTSTITASMISDRRKMTQPRRELRSFVTSRTDTFTLNAVSANYSALVPSLSGIMIPTWATRIIVSAGFSGMITNVGPFLGYLSPQLLGQTGTMETRVDENWTGDNRRTTYLAGGELALPVSVRGGSTGFAWLARKTSGTGNLYIDSGSTFTALVEFVEEIE